MFTYEPGSRTIQEKLAALIGDYIWSNADKKGHVFAKDIKGAEFKVLMNHADDDLAIWAVWEMLFPKNFVDVETRIADIELINDNLILATYKVTLCDISLRNETSS